MDDNLNENNREDTGTTSSTASASSKKQVNPLWNYVTKLDVNKAGGNIQFTCNFCNMTYCGSYSRVNAHLLRKSGQGIAMCAKVTEKDIEEIKSLDNNFTKSLLAGPVLDKISSTYDTLMDALKQEEQKKRKTGGGQQSISSILNKNFIDELDAEISRMFYSGGVPFNLARNPYYKRVFALLAAAAKIPGYAPPSYDALRTTLLKKERARIERLMGKQMSFWNSKGVSIVSDGWTDPQRRPLINFIAINDDGPMFLQAINCEGKVKDALFIADLMEKAVTKAGIANVSQIITDNAAVCKAAGTIIENKYPQIFWTPCAVHTANLVLKNICSPKNNDNNAWIYAECNWINKIVQSIALIRNFIINHSMRLSIFRKFSKLQLLHIVDTRFASAIVMIRRFRRVATPLKTMVIDEEWNLYRNDDVGKAIKIKDEILNDSFWESVDYILRFTNPIYDIIRTFDEDTPSLHLVYPMWLNAMSKVKKVIYEPEQKQEYEKSFFWDAVQDILVRRRKKCITPLHALAHSLNPRCSTQEWENENPGLKPPLSDPEVVKLRKECLNRLFF